MITFLRRLFIKNYKSVENPEVRVAHGKLAAAFGIVSNAILFALKLVFGLIAKSVSIVADSINNLSDFGSSTITLVGFKMSSKPADKEHPFGHQRIEYISGLIVSLIIVALAALLLYQSIERIISQEAAVYTIWSFVILGIAILFKLIQGYFNYRMSKIINSVALKATALDSLTDSIATTLLLASALVSYFTGWNIDGWMGCLIALFVGFSGVKMILETSSPLIGEATNAEEIQKIVDDIKSSDGVLGVHDIVAHNYGPTKIFMTIHCEVDPNVPVLETHDKIDSIEMRIYQKYGVLLTIHMDPIDTTNPETNRLREKVNGIIHGINDAYSIHDFRVVHGDSHTNVLLDIVIPHEFKYDFEALKNEIQAKLNEGEEHNYFIVINIDRPFVN